MLKPILTSCLALFLFFGCEESSTAPPEESPTSEIFITFGSEYDDTGNAVTQTPDGGYLLVGSSYSATTLSDLYAIKTDSKGIVTADSVFNAITDAVVTSFERASDVKVLPDGGYIIVGRKFTTATQNDVWLVKLNADLSVAFNKTIDSGNDDIGYSVNLCDDNGFIIAGTTYGSNGYDMWIIKTDASGDDDGDFGTGGRQSINGTANGNDVAYSIHQTEDGGYIVAGESRVTGNNADMIIAKLTSAGELSTSFGVDNNNDGAVDGYITFGGSLDETAKYVEETSDGGFILVGNSNSYGSGQSDIYIVKTDASGGKVWDTFIGGTRNDSANCVKQTADGGYIVVGNSYSTNSDVLVIKLLPNSQGDVEWQYTFGNDYDDVGNYISQTSDGGYILTGSTYTTDKMNQVLLIKLNADGSQEF
jgi:uncharacterized delta-60 repeat protein